MKKILLVLTLSAFSTSVFAIVLASAAVDVAKAKIKADKEVAMSKKAAVTVNNSSFDVKTKIDHGAVVGNSGFIAVGEDVDIENSKVKIDTQVDHGVMMGNSGVILGAH